MKAIASIDKEYGIGKNGQLLIHNKEDMKFFKETTIGHIVVMGRKTYESLPGLLKNRTNVILTRQNIEIPGAIVKHDIKEILGWSDTFVIGGAEIYKMFLPYYDEIYLTENKGIYDADAFFPKFDKSLFEQEEILKRDTFKIVKYTRKS